MNEEQSLIVISQLPVIQERLKLLQTSWEQKAKDAESMVCTEETVQVLKDMRAQMRKEFQEADAQRKAAKQKYMAPWEDVEAAFKVCVKEAFTRADESLKKSVDAFENEIKARCYAELSEYYAELSKMEGIDFLTLDQLMQYANIKISLSDAKKANPRKLRDDVAGAVSKIACGMEDISKMDDSPEIMAEFKLCLDVGRAVARVQERKRLVQQEREAEEARKAAQERFAASVDKVNAVAPPVASASRETAQNENDPVFESYTFTVYGARKSQLIKIREYLKQEGINYGK